MNKIKSAFLKLFILSATIFIMPAQASFLFEWAAAPFMYLINKRGKTQRSAALVKIFEKLLTSHNIRCKVQGHDTIQELQKGLAQKFKSQYEEIPVIAAILANNIYYRTQDILLSIDKKMCPAIIKAYAFREKFYFLQMALLKNGGQWECHQIKEIGGTHFYPAQYYFLPQKEELESLFSLFSDEAIKKRCIETQK